MPPQLYILVQHYFIVSRYQITNAVPFFFLLEAILIFNINTAQSMEIYREMGLYEEMRKESTKFYDENASIVDVESLAGKFLRHWMASMNEVHFRSFKADNCNKSY